MPALTEAAIDIYVQIGWAEDQDASRSRAITGIYELVNKDFVHPDDTATVVPYKDTSIGFHPLWIITDEQNPILPLARRQF